MNLRTVLALLVLVLCGCSSSEPDSTGQTSPTATAPGCPFNKLFMRFDLAYHSCMNGSSLKTGSCSTFVDLFGDLVPKYDCQRSFDTAPVPAIWLAEGGALEHYVRLLSRLALRNEKMFQYKWFDDASLQARTLFGSNDFRSVLDGHLAEEFLDLSYELRATSEQ